MEYVKIERRNADKAKKLMMRLNLFDSSRPVQHSRSYVYFPILNIKEAKAKKPSDLMNLDIVIRNVPKTAKSSTYEQDLEKKIGRSELDKLSRGYDQFGDIAIIEFKGVKSNEKKIANALMEFNKTIKTVLAKAGAVHGKYRTRNVKYIAGKKNYVAIYKENGCTFKFDVRKVFFSNRLSFERSRILELVKPKENIMVMFAGAGPFPIEIAKKVKSTKIVAIELNRFGYIYMKENIKINKLENVQAVLGDVKKKSIKYKNFADRIIMPLPMSSLEFLDDVYKIAKKKSIVHIYAFANDSKSIKDKIKEHAKRKGYGVKFIAERIVRAYSSTESEFGIDYAIKK